MTYLSVTDTPLFKDFPNLDIDWVQSLFIERKISKHHVVFTQGETADSVYIVKNGILTNTFESETRSFLVSYERPGDVIGETEVLNSQRKRLVTLTALYDVSLWSITSSRFEKLLHDYPNLYRRLFSVVGNRLDIAARKITYLAFLDARTRIIQLAVDVSNDRIQRGNHSLVWDITQQGIANELGLSRESVARVVVELEQLGVARTSRSKMEVLDLEGMKKLLHDEKL